MSWKCDLEILDYVAKIQNVHRFCPESEKNNDTDAVGSTCIPLTDLKWKVKSSKKSVKIEYLKNLRSEYIFKVLYVKKINN